MLKILILAWRDIKHPSRGGSEEYLHQIARRFVEQGHQVTFFASSHPGGSLPVEMVDGVNIIRRGNKFTVYLWAFWLYLTSFRWQNFDIIIDQHNGIPFFTPLYSSLPIICLVHHLSFEQWFVEEKSWLAKLGYWIERHLVPLAYRHQDFVTVSRVSREELMKNFNLPESQITVINPGINKIYKTKAKSQFPSLIYVGRLKKYKQIDQLIRALLRLKYYYPQLVLHIVGSGDYREELVRLVGRLRLSRSVFFHGYVSEELKTDLLSAAWLMVNPSPHEGWGISVIEANACGTAAVGHQSSGLADSIIHDQTGVLCNADSVYDLAQAVKSVIGQSARRHRLELSAYQRSLRFNWSNTARQWIEKLDQHAHYRRRPVSLLPLRTRIMQVRRTLPAVAVLLPVTGSIADLRSSLQQLADQSYPRLKTIALNLTSDETVRAQLPALVDQILEFPDGEISWPLIWSRIRTKYVFIFPPGLQADRELIAEGVYRLEKNTGWKWVGIDVIPAGHHLLHRWLRWEQSVLPAPPAVMFGRRPTKSGRTKNHRPGSCRYSLFVSGRISLERNFWPDQKLVSRPHLSLLWPTVTDLSRYIWQQPADGLGYLFYKSLLAIRHHITRRHPEPLAIFLYQNE